MRFAFANMSWLLLLVALSVLLAWVRHRERRKRLSRFAETSILSHLIPGYARRERAVWRSGFALATIVLLLVLALLRPQYGFSWNSSQRKGADIAIAVDVSDSMLAHDVAPSRLERARHEIEDLLGVLKGDRVSLVVFSGVAYIETPLTLDYGAFRLFLSSVGSDIIPVKGTNIEAAIRKGIESLVAKVQQNTATKLPRRGRAIILYTDGEDFDGDLERAGKEAADLGIRIYILGIGTPEGGPIPLASGLRKDSGGNVIITRLDEGKLRTLAQRTGGTYVSAISGLDAMTSVYDERIRKDLEATTVTGDQAKRWNEFFQIPLLIALALLVFGTDWFSFRFLRQGADKTRANQTKRIITAASIISFFLFFCHSAWADSETRLAEQGQRELEESHFPEASKTFAEALKNDNEDPRLLLSYGTSLYREGHYLEAAKAFVDAASKTNDKTLGAQALYNAGNSLVQHESYEDAIKSYEESLKLAPNDQETKDNLAYTKKLLDKKRDDKKKDNPDKKQQPQQQDEKKNEQPKDSQSSSGESSSAEQQQQQSSSSGDEQSSSSNTSSSSISSSGANQSSSGTGTDSDKTGSSSSSSSSSGKPSNENGDQSSSSSSSGTGSSSGLEEPEQTSSSSSSSGGKISDGALSSSSGSQTKEDTQDAALSEEEKAKKAAEQNVDTVLGYIDENRDKFDEFRRGKALQAMKQLHMKPTKDW